MSYEPSFSNNRRCWVEVDPEAVASNAAAVREYVGPCVGLLAVVKADAYGHGIPEIAPALAPHVRLFGVANLGEARALRLAVPGARVLLLSSALPGEREAIVAEGFEPAVSGVEEARAFGRLAPPGARVPLHFVVDTGMGRMGVWEEEAAAAFEAVTRLPGVRVVATATHLPCADEDEVFTAAQLERYARLVDRFRQIQPDLEVSHALNSAGLIRHRAASGDLVRTGLILYGTAPVPGFPARLRPALAMKSRVVLVRDLGPGRSISYGRTFVTSRAIRTATVCAGYADGYPRHLSGSGAEALVGGRRCPLLGRVTMDQMVLDVSAVEKVAPGDEVVLLGRQGEEEITAFELARWAGTIPWEILTGMQCRDGRVIVSPEGGG